MNVTLDSDVDQVIEGIQEDIGKYVKSTESFGQNRLRITSHLQKNSVYPEHILEYMALAGWTAERIDTEKIDGTDYLVIEFVRGDEVKKMAQRRSAEFETLGLDDVY